MVNLIFITSLMSVSAVSPSSENFPGGDLLSENSGLFISPCDSLGQPTSLTSQAQLLFIDGCGFRINPIEPVSTRTYEFVTLNDNVTDGQIINSGDNPAELIARVWAIMGGATQNLNFIRLNSDSGVQLCSPYFNIDPRSWCNLGVVITNGSDGETANRSMVNIQSPTFSNEGGLGCGSLKDSESHTPFQLLMMIAIFTLTLLIRRSLYDARKS